MAFVPNFQSALDFGTNDPDLAPTGLGSNNVLSSSSNTAVLNTSNAMYPIAILGWLLLLITFGLLYFCTRRFWPLLRYVIGITSFDAVADAELDLRIQVGDGEHVITFPLHGGVASRATFNERGSSLVAPCVAIPLGDLEVDSASDDAASYTTCEE